MAAKKPTNPVEDIIADQENLTLDRAMRAAPDTLTDVQIEDLVLALRGQRSRFIAADEKKAEKKAGVEQFTWDDIGSDEEPSDMGGE